MHGSSFSLAPEVFGRSGAVAVAALVLVPLAGLAWRRRWSSLVLGGSLAVLAVTLTPFLFERLSDAVSLSQSRRAAGFLPFAFAFAGGIAVLVEPARDLRAAARARWPASSSSCSGRATSASGSSTAALPWRRGSPSWEASSRSPRRSSFASGPTWSAATGCTACAARCSCSRPWFTASRTGARRPGRPERAHARARPRAARRPAEARASSSPTCRRATASPPTRRC